MDAKTFVKINALLPVTQARLVRGASGIGKSAMVKSFADHMGLSFVDLRLGELEPSDLVGMPYMENKITKYAAPWWWPKEKSVLFLDEADRCADDMQSLAMQLTLDRRCGGRDLPEDTLIFAAVNGEKYMTSDMDQALVNRFSVMDLSPTTDEWVEWAKKSNINKLVVGYITDNPIALDTPPSVIGRPNEQVPTRRSWTNLANALDLTVDNDLILPLAKSFVGTGEAIKFNSWISNRFVEIKAEDMFTGEMSAREVSFLQLASVIDQVANMFLSADEKGRVICLNHFMKAGPEAFAALFSALPSEAAQILAKYEEVDRYISKYLRK